MKRILIVHDGKPLSLDAKSKLQNSLQHTSIANLLYIIPQNLVHYGQVDQLASPICKDEFIQYVYGLGIEECQKALQPLVNELEQVSEANNFEIKLHVRWGNAADAILELAKDVEAEEIFIQQKCFDIDWAIMKDSSLSKIAENLHIL